MNAEIIRLNNFEDFWQTYLNKSDESLFEEITSEYFYNLLSYNYYSQYYSKVPSKCYSFCILGNKIPQLVAFISQVDDDILSYFHFPIKVFYNKKLPLNIQINLCRMFKEEVIKIISTNRLRGLRIYDDPILTKLFFEKISNSKVNYFGIVDLTIQSHEIFTCFSKSFKHLINWGKKNMVAKVMDASNFDRSIFDDFKSFHFHVSGYKTRSDETWETQAKMIQNGEAFLVHSYLNQKMVSCSLILLGKKEAYYGVGVYDRTLFEKKIPVAHYPLFFAILHSKNLGMEKFNMDFINLYEGNVKWNNISTFKRIFSTYVRSLLYHEVII